MNEECAPVTKDFLAECLAEVEQRQHERHTALIELVQQIQEKGMEYRASLLDHRQSTVSTHEILTNHDLEFAFIRRTFSSLQETLSYTKGLVENVRADMIRHEDLFKVIETKASFHGDLLEKIQSGITKISDKLVEHDDVLETIAAEVSGDQDAIADSRKIRTNHEKRILSLERGFTKYLMS